MTIEDVAMGGGEVFLINLTFFRWYLYPFYDSSADAPSLSPPPPTPPNIDPTHSTDTITQKGTGSSPLEKFRLSGTKKKKIYRTILFNRGNYFERLEKEK